MKFVASLQSLDRPVMEACTGVLDAISQRERSLRLSVEGVPRKMPFLTMDPPFLPPITLDAS